MTGTTPPDRWREIERVLDRALDLPVEQRGRYLGEACGGDVALRASVERLLRAHDRDGGVLDEPLSYLGWVMPADARDSELAARVPPGTAIAERYVVDRELGQGGTAVVYLAYDLKHGRAVAVKVLDADLAHGIGAARFLREIEITANLQHPHILPLHDSGELDGLVYYVMPYVAGDSLRDRLRREGRLSLHDAIGIARDVASALDYAHRAGVVHRDIKPANILLADGQAIVADFGIARALNVAMRDGRGGISSATQPGVTMGTPACMSPEQAIAGQTVGASTDIYSLGCVIYEMLAGEPPFVGATAAEVVGRHIHEPPPPLRAVRPDLPLSVTRAVEKALAKTPADRFASAGALVDALASSSSPSAERVRPGEHATADSRLRPSRRTLGRIALGAAVVVAAGAIAVATRRNGPPIAPSAAAIAVLPLVAVAPDTELARIGRELAITLSASLDGVGGIRTVDPLSVLARVRQLDDARTPERALDLARQLGARSVVYGSVVRDAGRARIDVAMYSTPGGESLARASVTAAPDDITALTDSAAWALLRQMWRRTDPPTPSLAAVTTRSIPALRAFLDGERLIAQGRWRAASEMFQTAVSLDSTFWLAYWRYASSRDFNALPVDTTIRSAYQAHRRELPERDRLLIEAGMPARQSERHERLRAVTDRFPDYWPAWWALSEHLAHTGPLFGTTDGDLRAALERTLALNGHLVSGLDHLFWVALWQRDTTLGGRVLGELTALRYDSIARQEYGYDVLMFDRYMDALSRSGGLPRDSVRLDAMVRTIASLSGPLNPHRFALGSAQYGFPRAQIELVNGLPARGVPSRTVTAWLLGVVVAHAQRGQWDSALVTMDRLVAALPDEMWPLYRYRLAVVGAWVGAIDLRAADSSRAAVVRVRDRLPLASRAELVWLDGLLALTRHDARSLEAARRELAGTDTLVRFLARSLAAYHVALAGDHARAADSLAALERDRAERGWSRFRSDAHPFLTAVNRLLAARWLMERGDAAKAERLLTWHQAVLFPMLDTREANTILEPIAYLEQARAAEALGRRELAAAYYDRFLWRYDAPPPAHGKLVDEARAALVRLRVR